MVAAATAGTLNTKYAPHVPCEEMLRCSAVDLTEVRELVELTSESRLFARKDGGEHGTVANNNTENRPPVDVDARLSAMTWRGADSAAINVTQRDVVASMLASGIGLEETVRTVLDATHACVSAEPEAAKWDWQEEEKAIWQSGLNFIAKDPDRLGVLVPDNMREAFDVAVTNRKKPSAVFRKDAGWHIRGYTPTLVAGTDVLMSNAVGVIGNAPAHKPEPPPKKFSIRPFVPFDLASLPPRQWLYGKHYQRRTVSATIAPGGFGKTTLGMVEAVAMATCRNLLEEQPTDRLRVWYHNGEQY